MTRMPSRDRAPVSLKNRLNNPAPMMIRYQSRIVTRRMGKRSYDHWQGGQDVTRVVPMAQVKGLLR